jgi:hypothetical protein
MYCALYLLLCMHYTALIQVAMVAVATVLLVLLVLGIVYRDAARHTLHQVSTATTSQSTTQAHRQH